MGSLKKGTETIDIKEDGIVFKLIHKATGNCLGHAPSRLAALEKAEKLENNETRK